MPKVHRRRLLVAAAVASVGVIALVSGCGGGDTASPSSTDGAVSLTVGNYVSGAPSVISMPLIFLGKNPDLQKKYGISVDVKDYASLSELTTDMARGRVGTSLSGPSSVASAASQGAPLAIAGTVARASNAILSTGKRWSAADLKGSRLVAQTTSSSWKSVEASIRQNLGLKSGADYEVVNSASTAAAAAQVAAGNGDYALVRAEQIELAQKQFPSMKVVAPANELGLLPGVADWGYVIEYNTTKVDAKGAQKLMLALAEQTDILKANPDEVEKYAVSQKQVPGVARDFLTSGTVQFDVKPVAAAKAELSQEFSLLQKGGVISEAPPSNIFG